MNVAPKILTGDTLRRKKASLVLNNETKKKEEIDVIDGRSQAQLQRTGFPTLVEGLKNELQRKIFVVLANLVARMPVARKVPGSNPGPKFSSLPQLKSHNNIQKKISEERGRHSESSLLPARGV